MPSIIDEDIEVKFNEGSVFFRDPGEAVWIQLTKSDEDKEKNGLTDEDRKKAFLDLITDVKDLSYKNGKPVTPESLKAREYSTTFYAKLYFAFFEEANRKAGVTKGPSEKNV